ncbi:hypothetical protein AG1IA_04584 [Rhizoctonia solani AG-1 IA]|uniref:Uncharacterized protein n=1 Tax=Thanatephorus cucumeris (strain AG1-IA) TaxID=983506 RepID=L8WTE0_THACA|nr:hypothetical protein AG1IA_04584 [Rhizoctonia solani AG-1 IA]
MCRQFEVEESRSRGAFVQGGTGFGASGN